jgi:hypothetical protein
MVTERQLEALLRMIIDHGAAIDSEQASSNSGWSKSG